MSESDSSYSNKKLIEYLGAEGKEELLPPDLLPFLEALDRNSPNYDRRMLTNLTQGSEIVLNLWYERCADEMGIQGDIAAVAIKEQTIANLYTDFAKGMVYAAKHFAQSNEGSDIDKIKNIAITHAPDKILEALGFTTRDGQAVGVYPRLLSLYNMQEEARRSGKLRGQGRTQEDHKIPGMFFNAKEMVFLTGIEESCHAQQMLKGRYKSEYSAENGMDFDAYENAECEQEAAALQQAAVKELGLGSTIKDPDINAPKTPKERAADRKKLLKSKKRGR